MRWHVVSRSMTTPSRTLHPPRHKNKTCAARGSSGGCGLSSCYTDRARAAVSPAGGTAAMKRALLLFVVCLVPVLVLWAAAPAWAFISTGDGAWVWQNPLPQGNDLNGVAFPDAPWLGVGRTAPSWPAPTVAPPGLPRTRAPRLTSSAVSFPDATHGWAVGTGDQNYVIPSDVILATATVAQHGRRVTRARRGALTAVCFADYSHGWAVGSQRHHLRHHQRWHRPGRAGARARRR